MIHALATLVIGISIGYLGQRSRVCFVRGISYPYILKDFYPSTGLVGLFIGALLGFTAFGTLGGYVPGFPQLLQTPSINLRAPMVFAVIGGFGVGFFSVLAGGCPFRFHVMAGEGRKAAVTYLLGFYAGILYFSAVVIKILGTLMEMLG